MKKKNWQKHVWIRTILLCLYELCCVYKMGDWVALKNNPYCSLFFMLGQSTTFRGLMVRLSVTRH